MAKQWRWDRGAANAGTPPAGPLVVKLSPFLTLTFHERKAVTVRLSCEGASKDLDVGAKVRKRKKKKKAVCCQPTGHP